MKRRLLLGLLFLSSLLPPVVANAQWQLDGAALSTAANGQVSPTIVSDGAGGAIVTWEDGRTGTDNIYAQRVDASGAVRWTTGGVALCTAANYQYSPTIVSDGAGGAIVAWEDSRNGNYDIYAQRVDGSGTVQWTVDGVALCTAAGDQRRPTIVSDGAGGAIVAWEDSRNGNYDIYAQWIDGSGTVQWTVDGVALCTAAGDQRRPTIVSDGAGGAIVAWEDYRNGASSDIYAQWIDASGTARWTANGVALCTAASYQLSPAMVADRAGGEIVAWEDSRNGNYDIYAQWIDTSGTVRWTADGVALCTAAYNQYSPTMVSDGGAGVIVTWQDSRNNGSYDIYAQRVDASGTAQWTADGVALCTAANNQVSPTIISDGAGGAIVAWQDPRIGTGDDIYAQRVSAVGTVQWASNGIALCTAAYTQLLPMIVSDGSGGAIVTWEDLRNGTDTDIYAQRVEGIHGYWYALPSLVSVADVPGDQGGHVKVNWTASGEDVPNLQVVTHYSLWRATDAVAVASAVNQGTVVRSPSDVPGDFQGRAVWTQHVNGADYYWEWLANVDAHRLSAYSYTAATRSDSTSAGTSDESFFVSAQTGDPFAYFDSNVMSGHSVDNLAPAAPLYLTAQRVGSDVQLTWHRVHASDLKDYALYRTTSSGVTPVPVNFLSNDLDTVYVDTGAPTTELYYIVTAYDVHANQSKPSNEANVSGATAAGRTPPVTALTVLQNVPNPFAASTRFEIGLPAASPVRIAIYDVAGRRVRVMDVAGVRGWQSVPFASIGDNGAPLASGVYFCRVRSGGVTVTRKMVIAR